MINATSESWKARKIFIFQHFSFYEELKCYAVEHKKALLPQAQNVKISVICLARIKCGAVLLFILQLLL